MANNEVKLFVIDVSKWQKLINWTKVKAAGVQGVIIRAGIRGYAKAGTLQTDEYFERNVRGAAAVGIPFGIYFFSQAINIAEAMEEADYTINLIERIGIKPEFPVYIDTEAANLLHTGRADRLSKDVRTAVVKAFCDRVQSRGYYAGIYASTSWFNSKLVDSKLINYDHWVAHYAPVCGYKKDHGMWQYSSTKTVPGITTGGVDHNHCYEEYPTLIRNAGLNGFKKPISADVPVAVKKTVEQVADEVLANLWGVGEERKAKLTAAGYSYSAVQNAVNEKLRQDKLTAVAKEVLAGKWGNGLARKARLTAAGYNYAEVQAKVNELL